MGGTVASETAPRAPRRGRGAPRLPQRAPRRSQKLLGDFDKPLQDSPEIAPMRPKMGSRPRIHSPRGFQ
eukprot:5574662-Pyramimonas_sp.AAC.1